jgi:phosphoribosylglycinamide formyltransferase-1
MLRLGVLASGGGTNLQALIDAANQPDYPAQVVCVGCNRLEAPAIERATRAHIATCVADRTAYPRRADRQARLLEALCREGVDLVVLAGFDEVLVSDFVQAYAGRILNTHPSLLPSFGGTMHAVAEALAHGVKLTGCTIHLVTDELDGGPIVCQAAVAVRDDDDVASLHDRIRAEEHRWLPAVVRAFAEGRVQVEGRRARVIGSLH